MRTKKLLVAILGCAMLLLAAGCAKKEPQTATVSLPSNPTTGYSWKVEQSNDLFEITSEFAEGEGGALGAGGTDTFTLTPQASGETAVMFMYGRSWEEAPESEIVYNVKIDKNMQITVESVKAEMAGSMEQMPETPQMEVK
ncbi:MAG: protease inhibitor I42 family protein [Clostridium sp.]|jgi:predicted secreted protein|nr:protease inhibitor I42 family protein [Clostridium sp.]MBQ5421380.1 protease inhibitor I42 family protein [Clostridium sp.]